MPVSPSAGSLAVPESEPTISAPVSLSVSAGSIIIALSESVSLSGIVWVLEDVPESLPAVPEVSAVSPTFSFMLSLVLSLSLGQEQGSHVPLTSSHHFRYCAVSPSQVQASASPATHSESLSSTPSDLLHDAVTRSKPAEARNKHREIRARVQFSIDNLTIV